MTHEPRGPETSVQSRMAARGVVRKVFVIYVAFAVIGGLALAVVFGAPTRTLHSGSQPKALIAGLLVILFFAATIINLGIQWAASIVAARRYTHDSPYRAVVVVAISQCVVFAVYASVVGFVLYYRLRAGGETRSLVPAIASILAGLYFLRLPNYMYEGLYGAPKAAGRRP